MKSKTTHIEEEGMLGYISKTEKHSLESSILQHINNIIVISDMQGKINYWNKHAELVYQYTSAEALGKNFQELLKPRYAQGSNFIKVDLEQTPFEQYTNGIQGIYQVTKKDGSQAVHEMTTNVLRDQNEQPIGLISIGKETTPEEVDLKILQLTEKRYRVAFEVSNTAIALVDLKGRFFMINKEAEKLLGYSVVEIREFSIIDVTHPEDIDIGMSFIKEALEGKRNKGIFRKRYLHKNGNTVWVDLSAAVVKTDDGQPDYFFCYLKDITQQKKEEEEKERYKQEKLDAILQNKAILRDQNQVLEKMVQDRTHLLDQKNKQLEKTLRELRTTQNQLAEVEKLSLIGQMFGGIAHEINNPINFANQSLISIKRNVEDLEPIILKLGKSSLNEYEKQKNIELLKELDTALVAGELNDAISDIKSAISRTNDIVTKLRDYTKRQNSEITTVSVEEFIKKAITISQRSLTKVFDVKLESLKNLWVKANETELIQAFSNILLNAYEALKSSAAESPFISISTKITESNTVEISIKDNGCGVSPNEIENVFDFFYSTKNDKSKLGLGLNISKQIIESHNGTISMTSEETVGSIVYVNLPLV